MTYPIPPPTSGAVTKFQPNVARCTFRTPVRIFRFRALAVFFAGCPRLGSGEGSEAMPFCPPGEKLRQRNLRARTYQHGPRVSRRPGRLCGKNAFPRICRYHGLGGPWQNSPAPGFRGVISKENNSRKYPVNLSKNPVNLSNFIEIYGNSIFSNEAPGFAIIPKSPESARTASAG